LNTIQYNTKRVYNAPITLNNKPESEALLRNDKQENDGKELKSYRNRLMQKIRPSPTLSP